MRHYENLVIIKPTFTAEEIQAAIKNVEEIITSNGGEIAAQDAMGMRKLAYPIAKNERGYYQVIYYSVAPAAIAEIERRFRINEDLLRFVTIKYDTNREVTAWNALVAKANKAATPAKEETPATEAPKAEETPAEEAPKAEETTEAAAE